MKRIAVAALGAAFLLLAAGFTLVAYAGSASRESSGVEAAFAERGHRVARAFEAPAFAAASRVDRPDVIVLVEPRMGFAPMLLAFAADGGEVWVFAADPGRTFASDARLAARALPGALHDVEAPGAAFDLSGARLRARGALALDPDGTSLAPVVRSGFDAFRDTNANGQLDPGEPAGPFVVAAAAPVGEGRLALFATEAPDEAAPVLVAALAGGEARALDVVVVDPAREHELARPAQAAVRVAAQALAESPHAAAFVVLGFATALLVGRAPRSEPTTSRALADALDEARARLAAARGAAPPALAILESPGEDTHVPPTREP